MKKKIVTVTILSGFLFDTKRKKESQDKKFLITRSEFIFGNCFQIEFFRFAGLQSEWPFAHTSTNTYRSVHWIAVKHQAQEKEGNITAKIISKQNKIESKHQPAPESISEKLVAWMDSDNWFIVLSGEYKFWGLLPFLAQEMNWNTCTAG